MCKYTRIHFGSLCVMFGDELSGDKAKINVIKNVKKEKAVLYDVMIWFDK